MKRDIPELLGLAEERVSAAEACIHRQRDLIEGLRRLGYDTTDADALLVAFEKVQAQFIAYRDWLLDELEEIATQHPRCSP